ncbi:MAG: DUF1800 domain-containing protein [candidate division NC10 bacterium]
MRRLPGRLLMTLVAAALSAACSVSGPRPSAPAGVAAPPSRIALPASPLSEEQQIVHVLNRLAYGPRPGDVERVSQMGLAAWIERQLDPAQIPDPAVERALSAYPVLTMTAADLLREYPRPNQQLVQKVKSGEMGRKEMMDAFPPERRPSVITAQMQSAKVLRAVMSERQLQEVMVDFWFNHFNVFAHKSAVRWMLPAYEREAIRPHALGRFKELVVATARHPAMLFYLDNWMSTREDWVVPAGPNRGRKLGLNENYARELMELHTLGVDGGYTQKDVVEVARCFTGWTIERPFDGGRFVFRAAAHDGGEKRVLGTVIGAGGGEQDGLRVIELLVRHPSTARFIATKLVRRFVADDPPEALVLRVARTFQETEGDIRAMLLAIFTSPEFFSDKAYRAKIKKPLEVVASAVRALDGQVFSPGRDSGGAAGGAALLGGGFPLSRQAASLGEPLYEAQPPTGHPDVAEAWVNTGALLGRMNFALGLAHNRFPATRVELGKALVGVDRRRPEEVLDRLLAVILQRQVSPDTRAVLAAQLDSPEITRSTADDRGPGHTDVERLAALVLGSPEFQRR